MPDMSGMEVLQKMRNFPDAPPVIILSAFSKELFAVQAVKFGAMGYLEKSCSRTELIDALNCVIDGKMYVSKQTTQMLLQNSSPEENLQLEAEVLSRQELTVFAFICKGITGKEIAHTLSVTPRTVSTYKARLMRKLEATTMTELLEIGISWGLCQSKKGQ